MSITINTQSTPQVSSYVAIPPVYAATLASNDHLPKSETPIASLGTIQQNAHNFVDTRVYGTDGKIVNPPGKLLGHA